MKKTLIALFALAAVCGNAQIKSTWSATLDDPEASFWTVDTVVAPNGSAYVLSMGDGNLSRITCYDGLGTHQWTKTYDYMDSDSGGQMLVDSMGNLIVRYCEGSSYGHVAKFDGTNGTKIWDTRLIPTDKLVEIEMDGQENIIVLGSDNVPKNGPVVMKLSPGGEVLQTRLIQPETEGFRATRLAVAANGQVYTMYRKDANGVSTQRLEALTPNFTLRYGKTTNQSYEFLGAHIATDRNGRLCSVERIIGNPHSLRVRTFNAAGSSVDHEVSVSGRSIYDYIATFDANGRLVISSSGGTVAGAHVDCEWYSVTDTTLARTQRAVQLTTDNQGATVRRLVTDHFGQSYLYASVGSSNRDTIYAFDENRTAPHWIHQGITNPRSTYYNAAAVGRWGQVILSSTSTDPVSIVDTDYIKQLGLRNLTINGQSFTGGRTITGTVNFYSSHTANRTVSMSSNTSFATIAPTVSVALGSAQSNMSIDLQPTAVRRAVRIEGMYGGTKRSAVFYIEPPVASGLTVYPTTVKGGANVNGSARINGAAPTGGMNVSLSSNDPATVVPGSVNVPEGAVTKAFTVNTNVVAQTKVVTLTATTGATSKTAILTVTP